MRKISFKSLKSNKLDLVVLVGGKGTRIKEYLNGLPKPMAKFNNIHFLQYILNLFSKYPFKRIFLLTKYKSNIIFNKFHNKKINFIKIICIKEKKQMGTGGALNNLKNKIQDFVLINGDTLFDINLDDLIKSLKKENICSIALTKKLKQKSKKLNSLEIKKNLVKYKLNGSLINGGIYFFKKKIFNYIPNKHCSLENDILPKFIKKGKVNGKSFNNFFIDIGSKEYFKKASKKLKNYFKRPAIFLDRDGVINHHNRYVYSKKKFVFRNGVTNGLKYLINKKYYIFIVTNQAGIGKKIFTENQFNQLHLFLKKKLYTEDIYFDDVKYSPYHPLAKIKKYRKSSNLRKPGNLMIIKIQKKWLINKKKSFMIGDQLSDKICAKKSDLYFEYAKKNFYNQVKKIIKKI